MKIVLIGYHNPHFINTIVYREEALIELGHELISLEESNYVLPGRIRQCFSRLQQWDLKRLNRQLFYAIKQHRPDLCLVVGGHTMLPETIDAVRKIGIPIALWTTDVPVRFEGILQGAPYYSHLFCAGTEAADIFKNQGFKHVTWLPFACAERYHRPMVLTSQEQQAFARDVVFVGSYYPNRARILESLADLNIGVWGPYWSRLSKNSSLKDKAVDQKINYDRWVKIFNAAKINLVIHYQDGQVPCHQASPKIFEALACGSFVMSDQQKDVQALFKDQEHLVFFNDEKDLRQKAEYYLAHEQQRKRIAQLGREKVLAEHSYGHRMRWIVEQMTKTGA